MQSLGLVYVPPQTQVANQAPPQPVQIVRGKSAKLPFHLREKVKSPEYYAKRADFDLARLNAGAQGYIKLTQGERQKREDQSQQLR